MCWSMRSLTSLCFLLLPLGCGFDTRAPGGERAADGSGSTTATGSAAAIDGGSPNAGGWSSQAGQLAGTSSTAVTPTGGSNAQGGSSNITAGSNSSGGNTAGGDPGMGGSSNVAGGGGGPTIDPRFKLAWRDDFNDFDDTRWTKQTHTFAENLARFGATNVVVEGGVLKLKVTKVQNGDKAYTAGEIASKDSFTFGRFAGRIKFCAGSGLVSSLFTYKDDVSSSWQEIDIEHLGNLPKSVQYNLISGNLNNRIYQPKVVTFTWGPPLDFHDYVIEWRPDGVTFFVDGTQTHRDVQVTLKDAARLHMNAWPTDNAVTSFAGPFDASAVPCEAQYDWVEAYAYTP